MIYSLSSWFYIVIAGLIQGITEFFPISSSGHLKIFHHYFSTFSAEERLWLDVVCHLGTLFAMLYVFRREFFYLLKRDRERKMLVLATLPLVLGGVFLKSYLSIWDSFNYLGWMFLVTAAILYFSSKVKFSFNSPSLQSFYLGACQLLALLPGVSRSGSVMGGAASLGWPRRRIWLFSFLMSIPAVLGAVILMSLKTISLEGTFNPEFLWGGVSSFFIGLITASWLKSRIDTLTPLYFAPYCAFLSLLLLAINWYTQTP